MTSGIKINTAVIEGDHRSNLGRTLRSRNSARWPSSQISLAMLAECATDRQASQLPSTRRVRLCNEIRAAWNFNSLATYGEHDGSDAQGFSAPKSLLLRGGFHCAEQTFKETLLP
jgi:hypothetical protein